MYVRLKHALSALALEAIRRPSRGVHRDAAVWLAAFCDVAGRQPGGPAAGQPLSVVARRARLLGARGRAALPWILREGLLVRRDGLVHLPDGFQPHFAYLDRQTHRLAAALRRLAARPPARGRAGAIRRGLVLLDAGLFFECHEYFEEIWRRAPWGERDFYRGIIHIAAGLYHCEKGNAHGARTKLASGMRLLAGFQQARQPAEAPPGEVR
jgi:hypothetical protein